MYPIVQAPNEILRTPAVPSNLTPEKLKKIISEMTKTLLAQKDHEGVGLAANQVGLPYQIFLARFTTKKSEPVRVFINPKIIDHSEEIQEETKNSPLEGCLSVPKYYGVVKRWKWVKMEYQAPPSSWSHAVRHPGASETSDRIYPGKKILSPFGLQNDAGVSLQHDVEVFEGFPAVVIQHEMDHLNGKIFVERILEQNGQMYKITGKDKKGKEKWEEVEL